MYTTVKIYEILVISIFSSRWVDPWHFLDGFRVRRAGQCSDNDEMTADQVGQRCPRNIEMISSALLYRYGMKLTKASVTETNGST